MIRPMIDQSSLTDTISRLNAIQLNNGGKIATRIQSTVEAPTTTPADFLGRSLSQEEVIPSRSNGLGFNCRNSLLRSSSDCTGSSGRQVHPQPLMSRYAFERRSIRRSKVLTILILIYPALMGSFQI